MQKDNTNKLMEKKENLERRFNQAELQLKEEQEKNFKLSEDCDKLKTRNEELETKLKETLKDLVEQMEQKDQAKKKLKELSTTQHDTTNKFLNIIENLLERLNQAEHLLEAERRICSKLQRNCDQLEACKKELETNLEKLEKTIKDLEKELEQKEQERQMFEDLSTTQKDNTNKLMEEKENLERRFNQAEYLLEAEERIGRQLRDLEEKEMKWTQYLKHPFELEYNWSEIVGLDDIKKEIREKILEPLENPDKRLHNRVLLHGPSWGDKNDLIRATAKSAGLCVFDFSSWSIGKDKDFKAVISMLRKMQPVIVHVYNNYTGLKDIKRLLNEITPEDKIIVVVQTDNIKDIDSDVPNLFSLKIEIPLPDKDRRIEIMRQEIERKEIQISEDIDWDELSNRLEEWKFNDIQYLCNEASRRAKNCRRDNAIVKMKDMTNAIRDLNEL